MRRRKKIAPASKNRDDILANDSWLLRGVKTNSAEEEIATMEFVAPKNRLEVTTMAENVEFT